MSVRSKARVTFPYGNATKSDVAYIGIKPTWLAGPVIRSWE
jgi:hypothetical protein